jgi:quercetin dioxygenase-like cupin family protein
MKPIVNATSLSVAGLAAVLSVGAFAQEKTIAAEAHRIVRSADLKWKPIISGWEIAVVSGDLDTVGQPFVIRFRGVDGAKVPPHWHPSDENITVLRGTFLMGMGETYDPAKMQPLSAGSFSVVPKEMRHFARAKGETLLQAHGIGPFKVNWVNPAEVVPPVATPTRSVVPAKSKQ